MSPRAVDAPNPAAAGQPGGRRLVLVPVARFDLRATVPLEYSRRIPAAEHSALHVATDERILWTLADAWMGMPESHPLRVVEHEGSVPRTIARVVEYELAAGYDEVIVLVGQLALRRRLYRLLHDRSAVSIQRAVSRIDGVTFALVTVASA